MQRMLTDSYATQHEANPYNRSRIPVGFDEDHHQFIQWDKIDSWMEERRINVFAPGMIVHPLLGKRYELTP